MRHLRAGRQLSIDSQHRTALRRNLARGLFLKGRILTTPAKAKAVRPYVERLVTRAKRALELQTKDRAAYIHQLRLLAREIPDKKVLALLVGKIAPLCKDRPGGYTRIIRDAGCDLGDAAPRAFLEFVDRPKVEESTEGEAAEASSDEKGAKKAAGKKPAAKKAPKKAKSESAAVS